MFKKIKLAFVIVTMFVTPVLFMSTDVLAQCDGPECFAAGGCEVKVVRDSDGKFPIFIDASSDPSLQDYCLTDWGNGGPAGLPCALFKYEIVGSCSYSQMAQALPDPATYCQDDQWDILDRNIPSTWQPACAGDSDTKWYQDDCSIRVLESQPNVSGFFFITTTNVSANPAPAMVKAGKKMYYGTLLAPSCWVAPPLIAQTEFAYTITDLDGTAHTCQVTRNQKGELVEIKIDGAIIDPANWFPMSAFIYCVPDDTGSVDPGGIDTDGVKYLCHKAREATDKMSLTGNPTGSNSVFIKPPGIWVKW